MDTKSNRNQWIKTGAISGLAGGLMYFAAAFIPMPDLAVYVAAFSFGPLLAIGCTGLYHFLSDADKAPRLQIALVSAIAGGITILIMLTVQQSIFGMMPKAPENGLSANEATLLKIRDGLNSVHWGMDVAWDILICTATILFSWSMIKRTGLWKLLGGLGIVFGLLLLSFNLYYFPTPPASVNAIDWGPFVAIWFLIVFVVLMFKSRSLSKEVTIG